MVSIIKPTVGGDADTWGTELNTALDVLVGAIDTNETDINDLQDAVAAFPPAPGEPFIADSASYFINNASATTVALPNDIDADDLIVVVALTSYPVSGSGGPPAGFSSLIRLSDYVCTYLGVKNADGTEGGTNITLTFDGSEYGQIFIAVVRDAGSIDGYLQTTAGSAAVASLKATAPSRRGGLLLSTGSFRSGAFDCLVAGTTDVQARNSDPQYAGKMVTSEVTGAFSQIIFASSGGTAYVGAVLISFSG